MRAAADCACLSFLFVKGADRTVPHLSCPSMEGSILMTQPTDELFGDGHRTDSYLEIALPPTSPAHSAAVASAARPERVRPGEGEPAAAVVLHRSVLEDFAVMPTETATPEPALWGARGRVRQLTGGLVKLKPGSDEVSDREAKLTIRQTMWVRPVHITVANPKGGVGKTPSVKTIGDTLAEGRGGSVVIWDAPDAAGSIGRRAEGTPARGLAELLERVDTVSNHGELGGYVAPQSSGADVIGSIADRAVLLEDDIVSIERLLDRYYRISIADTGNNMHSSAFVKTLELTDALVVPTIASVDSLFGVLNLLDVVRRYGHPELADTATILFMHNGSREDPHVDQKLRALTLRGETERTLFDIPFDPHIAAGGEMTLAKLSAPSRRAWTRASARIVQVLKANVH
ncbi:MinD/ParA family ATP-binding protein [Subtercola vilae]|uniref:ParA family protein n=1 Tax=Subtercola vilae TaxID=2056433 RepID=A0A4V4REF1_9MICO|nr:hypothetical protein [Subtercola vilae]TIH33784.1 hypothetical protein D4765_13960 [Subtercola vilae]